MYRHALWLLLPVVCLAQPSSYTISTVAGENSLGPGFAGDGSAATSAQLNTPIGIAVDASHNLYIADSANQRIRKVTASNGNISTYAGSLTSTWAPWTGDGGAATSATLFNPYGVWVDKAGNLFIADLQDQAVRKVNTSGIITTFAGDNFPTSTGDGGPATSASMTYPFSVVGDAAGNLYISASNDNRVRRVAPDGTISTYAGNGTGGFAGEGVPATSASVHSPYGLAVDAAGNLYIADSQNNRIRKVSTGGIITTVAGTGVGGFSGDGGPATSAQIDRPFGVAVDLSGSILIADYLNQRIRRVTPDGIISTIAGGAGAGYSGDGGAATSARLNLPTDVAVDTNGNVYVADSQNNVIRLLTPSAPAVSGGGG
ncbi:NHL repeat containing protein (fragment) [Candidatus Sulfopaludibacter sp. SbA3]